MFGIGALGGVWVKVGKVGIKLKYWGAEDYAFRKWGCGKFETFDLGLVELNWWRFWMIVNFSIYGYVNFMSF